MSKWGRAQDALWGLWEVEMGYGPPEPGPAQKAGLTFDQWSSLIEPILEAVAWPFEYFKPETESK